MYRMTKTGLCDAHAYSLSFPIIKVSFTASPYN